MYKIPKATIYTGEKINRQMAKYSCRLDVPVLEIDRKIIQNLVGIKEYFNSIVNHSS